MNNSKYWAFFGSSFHLQIWQYFKKARKVSLSWLHSQANWKKWEGILLETPPQSQRWDTASRMLPSLMLCQPKGGKVAPELPAD